MGAVCQLKGKMKKPKFETLRISPIDGKSVFNYSCQSLNSAELAKKHLRQEMAKVSRATELEDPVVALKRER